jgi:hypothetical protein
MTRAFCVTAALLVSAAALLPAQSRFRDSDFGLSENDWCREARDADHCEVREETLRNLRDVDIDARGNGGVHVRGWDRSDVHVRVRLSAWARDDNDARRLIQDTRLVTGNGKIGVDGPRRDNDRRDRRNWRDREWWAASFEVQVPRDTRLVVAATNGGLVLEDMRGTVDARTTNGGLRLYDVAGDVRGQAVNGGIVVDLTGNRWEGRGLDVRTTNGGVRLSVPSNYSADLEARTVNGGLRVDFPITVSGLLNGRPRELRTQLGSGGAPLRVATTNGGVQIVRR